MIVGPPIGAAGIAGSCGKIYCLWHGKRGGHTLQCVNSVLLMYKFGFCGVFYAKSVAGKVLVQEAETMEVTGVGPKQLRVI
jgi:hypothetical protein